MVPSIPSGVVIADVATAALVPGPLRRLTLERAVSLAGSDSPSSAAEASGPIPASRIAEMLSELSPALRRTVGALPDPMLAGLARGLDANYDRLVPGRLFRARSGGGCAVGVMLQELDPDAHRRGPVRFWLRDRWRRGSQSYGGELARNPRLRHLEGIFDGAVKRLRGLELPKARATRVAGAWIRAEVEAELQWRGLERAAAAPSSLAPGRCPTDTGVVA